MAEQNLVEKEVQKFRVVSGAQAVAVVNPDGTSITGGGANATVNINSAVTLYAVVNTTATEASPEQAMATLYPRTDYFGLVSVSGNVVLQSAPTLFALVNTDPSVRNSMVTINPRTDYFGLVSVSGNVNLINLVSLASGTNVGLNPSANFIGLATVVPAYNTTYTSFATVISASGAATLFTPPSSQRWILKDLLIGSLGRSEFQIQSGANTVIPLMALATTGGYISNFGDNGLQAKVVDDAFVVTIQSTATLSVTANVRFGS